MRLKRCPIDLPPVYLALWYELSATGRLGSRALAARMGTGVRVVQRALTDLERLNLVVDLGDTYQASNGTPSFIPKRDENNGFVRCKHCRQLAESRVVCPKCHQLKRSDRAWRARAIRMARQGLPPAVISAKLNVPLWDYAKDDREEFGRKDPGVVSVLLSAGLLGPEWRQRQRNAASGGDYDG